MKLTAKLEMKAVRIFSFVNLKIKAELRVQKNCCIESDQHLIKSNIQVRRNNKNF